MARRFMFDPEIFEFGSAFGDCNTIASIWRDFDKLFSAVVSTQAFPPYNMYALKDGSARVDFAVAGYDRENITINAVDGKLVVTGKKDFKEENRPILQGIHGSNFEITVPFEAAFDLSKASAKMKNGMLSVTVPLAEERKARTVTVEVAD